MGSVFSPPKISAPPTPPPPPAPPPPDQAAARDAGAEERRRRAGAQGRASTILTGGSGLGSNGSNIGRKSLLGG